MLISKSDKAIIRDLAKEQYDIASSHEMKALKQEWVRHNDCKPGRAMVTIEWQTFAKETLDPQLKTKGKIAREIEKLVLSNFIGHKLFKDDSVVNDFMSVVPSSSFTPFDISIKIDTAKDSIGHHFYEVIEDLETDFSKLKPSTYSHKSVTQKIFNSYLLNLVGDILPIKTVGKSLYSVPTQDIVHIMSLENMMFSMYDYPDLFHKMMDNLTDDYIKYFNYLQDKGLVLTTFDSEWVGQGSYAFNSDLKKDFTKGQSVALSDIWGFMDSQETSTISPDMYAEFIFPYYKKVADCFGLLSYGCCEAVDPIWKDCLSKLTNLRKLSISPWCNEEYMGEQLAGKKIVYHRKPSPNFIGVDKILDKFAFEKYVQKTVDATKNCVVEFTQRDVYTVHNDMQKVRDYVNIIRKVTQQ